MAHKLASPKTILAALAVTVLTAAPAYGEPAPIDVPSVSIEGADDLLMSAPGSTVAYDGLGRITVTAKPNRINNIAVKPVAELAYEVTDSAGVIPQGCLPTGLTSALCLGEIHYIEVFAGDGDDTVNATALGPDQTHIYGDEGDDTLTVNGGDSPSAEGGAGNDRLSGTTTNIDRGQIWDTTFWPGPGIDVVHGGPGREGTVTSPGSDVIDGGGGLEDWVSYANAGAGVTVTLDGVPDDGVAGQRDNVLASVENVKGSGHNDRIVGGAAANTVADEGGSDHVTGGPGLDTLEVYGDYVDALDGKPDILSCNSGTTGRRDYLENRNSNLGACPKVKGLDFRISYSLPF